MACDSSTTQVGTRSDGAVPAGPVLDGHRSAERRSLAMHCLIAQRLDEQALVRARTRVAGWNRDAGPVDHRWASAWNELLSGSVASVAAAITRNDAETRQLRQTSPFAGALSNAERWQILREVR